MPIVNAYRGLLLLCSITLTSLCHADQNLLQTQDINKIMKQIFEQHVDKKAMTMSILKKSFKIYIDQFDPDRIYLLDSEVAPYINMSDAQIQKFMEQYEHDQFQEFIDLNTVIQRAITRARALRASLEEPFNLPQLFQSSNGKLSNGSDEWSDPDLKRSFAKNEDDLRNRIRQEIIKFVSNENTRYGRDYVSKRQQQTIRLFERRARDHEDQYLYVYENGQKMSEPDKQNAFTMHVLKAMANSLDSHTTVLNPTEAYDMRVRLEKEMQGVGIVLQPSPDGFVITQLVNDGPAAKSGLVKINDKLIEVNGAPVRNEPLNKVMELLRGQKGTQVSLVLKRRVDETGNMIDKTINVNLTREDIAVNQDRVLSNYVNYDGDIIGVIRLDSFYQGDNGISSENDVRDAIQKLDKNGTLRGLILDLRENGGGFLSQAVKVAGLFITNGVVVISKYFNGEEHFYRDMDGKLSYDGPLIVLTSKATASAAEIVAQALQDYGVALIVGDDHTYGKGTIQSQTVTENKASTFFKVTVGKYYTVSGKTPQLKGVQADIVVPSQFAHENMGEEHLEYPLKSDTIAPAYDDNLSDIATNLKPWYMHYYTPTIQRKKLFWDNILPELRKNSAYRMSQNKLYQQYIKGAVQPGHPKDGGADIEDMQMSEAIAIMKDMIRLQAQLRGNEPSLQGSSSKPVSVRKLTEPSP